MTPEFLILGVIWYIVFLFSTTCHEGAHSLVAHLGGDPPRFMAARYRSIRFRTSAGSLWARSLCRFFPTCSPLDYWVGQRSLDPAWQQRYPRRAAWMALAGPAANFTLVILSALAIRGGIAFGFFRPPESAGFTHIAEAAVPGIAGFAATFLSILFVLNLLLGTFNLLPMPPLDGNTGITIFMSQAAALRFLDWTRNQGLGMAGLLLAWVLFDRAFPYIFSFSLGVLYPGFY